MKDKFYSKKTVVNNYNTHTGRVGDTYLIVSGTAIFVVCLVAFVAWIVYRGVMTVAGWIESALFGVAEWFRNVNGIVTDPEVKVYFIAMAILFSVLVICIMYLIKRFNLNNTIAKFFTYEDDKDWNDFV